MQIYVFKIRKNSNEYARNMEIRAYHWRLKFDDGFVSNRLVDFKKPINAAALDL